ncbi:ATP-binding protein [Alienimonas californiensis]|uniref:Putative ATPase YjoB n=1 Tax=Alienimonas californiensis TaxID=2527989 RepID=A0A517P4D0_9PLAN|nr:ATP-binding protein [Alienimonas californiensis]QDT14229.1 putative ATPase YjoB [Alienimonas californiensis]
MQAAAPATPAGRAAAEQFLAAVGARVRRGGRYRGKALSLEAGDQYEGLAGGVTVHALPAVSREQVILPAATLDLLDRNVLRFAADRPRLRAAGLPTKKGLLFYGPPGTGKTHTVRYLASALPGCTTLLVTEEQVGLLGQYVSLARLLAPSLVVIEDADLIARDRESMGNACGESLLNKLLNDMDGLKPDADVLFVLTTNRPEALEGALAGRPGRIDQAVEFPPPDREGREQLIRLYARGATVSDATVADAAGRTEGVSAAFRRELIRRSTQFAMERTGPGDGLDVTTPDVAAALEELLISGGSLNRALLGAGDAVA